MSDPTEFKGQPVQPFVTPTEWRAWLAANHAGHPGLWVRMFAKASGKPTKTRAKRLATTIEMLEKGEKHH